MAVAQMTQQKIAESNERLCAWLDDPAMRKQANAAVDDYIRMKAREEGLVRRFHAPASVVPTDLHKQVDTELPVIVCEREPDNPASVSVGFGTFPDEYTLVGDRFRVIFERILSQRYVKDVELLLTYTMDIREVISSNAMKDNLAEEDRKYFGACDAVMLGANTAVPAAGNSVLWRSSSGGITRNTFVNALSTLNRAISKFSATTLIINHVTEFAFMAWGRDEYGGDMSEDVLKNGVAERQFAGRRMLVTIKDDIVPENAMYMFADPRGFAKHFELTPLTMYVDKKAFTIEFFTWMTSGMGIANVAGVARHDFN